LDEIKFYNKKRNLKKQLHYTYTERANIGDYVWQHIKNYIKEENIGMLFFYVHVTVHRNKFLYNKTIIYTNFTNLFWHETLHFLDSSSVHHQEFIHCTLSIGICLTDL